MIPRPLVRFALLILAAAGMTCGWAALLRHNLARGERVVREHPERQHQLVLSADFIEYRDYFRQFPTRVADISRANSEIEFYKRPLFGPISAALTIILHRITGADYPVNLFVILPLYATIAVLLLFWICRRAGLPTVAAAATSVFGAASFAWLSVFSVPESYSLSVCAALAAILAGMAPVDGGERRWPRSMLRHGIVPGLAAWVYLPLAGASLLVFDRVRGRRQLVRGAGPCIVLSLAFAAAPHLLRGREALQYQFEYGARWSSFAHFTDPALLLEVSSAFLWFGLVRPVADMVLASPMVDVAAAMAQWPVTMAVVLLSGGYVLLVRSAVRRGDTRRYLGGLLWFGALFVFHVFFNPREVLLHIAVPTAVLLYLLALAAGAWIQERDGSRSTLILTAAAVWLLAVNLGAVVGW